MLATTRDLLSPLIIDLYQPLFMESTMTRHQNLLLISAALIVVAAFGCGETEVTNDNERPGQAYENDPNAKLCVVPQGEYMQSTSAEVTLEEDAPLEMIVGLSLVGSVERGAFIEEYCTVELDGETLVVESRVAFGPGSPSSGTDSAYLDPRFMACDMPALAPGEYDVVHGESTFTLTIPSDENLDCGDNLFVDVQYHF